MGCEMALLPTTNGFVMIPWVALNEVPSGVGVGVEKGVGVGVLAGVAVAVGVGAGVPVGVEAGVGVGAGLPDANGCG